VRRNILICASVILLGACATTPQVRYDADPTANIAAYRSYSWAFSAMPSNINPLLYQRVKDGIDRTLASRGYSASQNGDFAVAFTLGSRDRTEVTTLGSYGAYYRPMMGWGGMNSVDVRNVTEGTLAIDIYDVASKRPVWHGTATHDVGKDTASQEKVDAAVAAILANFPPPAKK